MYTQSFRLLVLKNDKKKQKNMHPHRQNISGTTTCIIITNVSIVWLIFLMHSEEHFEAWRFNEKFQQLLHVEKYSLMVTLYVVKGSMNSFHSC